jgi:hypothetical protein
LVADIPCAVLQKVQLVVIVAITLKNLDYFKIFLLRHREARSDAAIQKV